MRNGSRSAEIRSELGHPIIDADGHMREFVPAALPYLRDALGAPAFGRYLQRGSALREATMLPESTEQRRRSRVPQGAFWASVAENTVDRATSALPGLLYERLGELGIDFVVLYPTEAMGVTGLADDELRLGLCRGFNEFFAAISAPYRDRIAVAGLIPMHTPAEAIAELDHCAELGLKVACIPHDVMRPIPEPPTDGRSPYLWPGQTHWLDTFGLDSAYDYDPVWERFRAHGFAVTVHGGMTLPKGIYTSITSFTFNHLGSHAGMMYPLCKSLFLGGVTKRFPGLPFAFLECGVGWAATLLADLVEHWEKRNINAIQATRPDRLDVAVFERLLREYGGVQLDRIDRDLHELVTQLAEPDPIPEDPDEWRHVGVSDEADIVPLFARPFYFGCESDDRTVAFAFSKANPFGAKLQPVFSSDIGHWDVRNMNRVVEECFGLVEDGVLTADDFRSFVFENPARLYLDANPKFFEGTAVAQATAGMSAAGAVAGAGQ